LIHQEHGLQRILLLSLLTPHDLLWNAYEKDHFSISNFPLCDDAVLIVFRNGLPLCTSLTAVDLHGTLNRLLASISQLFRHDTSRWPPVWQQQYSSRTTWRRGSTQLAAGAGQQ
jgi:hypothetical protein